MSDLTHPALSTLHPAVRGWFARTFDEPSPPQTMGWPAVAAGKNLLLLAPTGSGKTLAAFLQCISDLYARFDAGETMDDGVRVLYISPLKALNNDIYKNLEIPLAGIAEEATRMGLHMPRPRTAVRTGDTPAGERRQMLRQPPHILITTPESLFLILSSKAREILRTVEYVIVDEIHALFPNKRGVHLTLSLEHLESLTDRSPQRIGLSATQRPLDEVAAFLGGGAPGTNGTWIPRPVGIIDTGQRKALDLEIILPVDDLRTLPDRSIWPSICRQILGLVHEHRTTLVFVNNRRLAERLTANLNETAGTQVAMTHHGSLAREKRLEVEGLLKEGKLPCLVATSSLELGIDIGGIDLVIQVESPKEVARGLQRVGRAGHLVGMPSKGRVIPKTRGDLLECAAIVHEMRTGLVEEAHAPENCLDVLAQQLVSFVAVHGRPADALYAEIRRAYPYRRLPRPQFDRVLDMLAGGYENEQFRELQPRIFWDKINGLVRAADRGRRLVYTSGGTIPDRGYFGVYLHGSNTKLGEVDEEFVAERRLWERFVLGTSAWRIEEIRQDRVIVTPAGRGEAMIPFWKGEILGRSCELSLRIGAFLRRAERELAAGAFMLWATESCLLSPKAARNLEDYLRAQMEAAGCLPHDKQLLIEEFPDELGEWRIMLHTPFGGRVHAPLALLLQRQCRERYGLEIETMHDDNGILLHCPGAEKVLQLDLEGLPLEGLEEKAAEAVRGSSLFALVFRQNAARALLLPRGAYGRKRTPLWLARLRASDLLQVVSAYPEFPIVLETLRDCLTGSFDLDGLRRLLSGVRSGEITVRHRQNAHPSPFTQNLQFNFFGTYMYVPDLPKGEQRFRALGMPRAALRELLGGEDLRDLLDPLAIKAVSEEAGGLAANSRPRHADELHAWLIRHGELPAATDLAPPAQLALWLEELRAANRAVPIAWTAGEESIHTWVAAEDAPLFLAALPGCDLLESPGGDGFPEAEASEARARLIDRYARTHGPFTLRDLQSRYALGSEIILAHLEDVQDAGRIQSGEFTPGVAELEWCDVGLLQQIHRRSLARARREIEPRGPAEYTAFLARWQGVGANAAAALGDILQRMSGLWLPHWAWGEGVFPARLRGYREDSLTQLIAGGRFAWVARGMREEMKLAFVQSNAMGTWENGNRGKDPGHEAKEATAIHDLLASRGALFLGQIVQGTGLEAAVVLKNLEELMGRSLVTNDNLGPLSYFTANRPASRRYFLTQSALNAMGRWSLVGPIPENDPEAIALMLLERYGLVTRDLAARDSLSWEAVAPIYDTWEAVGKVRRGYFINGLSGLQYALPEAVEGLRMPIEEGLPEYWALSKCDPANPYGSILDMPEPVPSGIGIQADLMVFRRGEPLLAAGGKKMRLVSFKELTDEVLAAALREFAASTAWRGKDRVAVVEYNGRPIAETEAAEVLKTLGFERGYKEMVRWRRD